MFRLLDIPWWYYAIAIFIGIAVWKTWRWDIGILAGYGFLMLCITILARGLSTDIHYQPKLFWSWHDWDNQRGQILANILMFIPVGFLLGRRIGWWSIPFAAGVSVVIEFLQRATGRGLMEYDDVIHNTFGTVIGVGIIMLINIIMRKRKDET